MVDWKKVSKISGLPDGHPQHYLKSVQDPNPAALLPAVKRGNFYGDPKTNLDEPLDSPEVNGLMQVQFCRNGNPKSRP